MIGDLAADALTHSDDRSDPRVIVVAFDTTVDGAVPNDVAFRNSVFMKDIVVSVGAAGAAAVGLIDFDSSAFSDGAGAVLNIVASDDVQRLAVIPLHDATFARDDDEGLPLLTRFRVDALSSDVSGIGTLRPVTVDVVRTVPELARVDNIENGADFEVPDFLMEQYEERATNLTVGFSLRLASMVADTGPTNPSANAVTLDGERIPLENGSLRIRWSDDLTGAGRGRVIPHELLDDLTSPDLFRGAIVLVGTVDPAKSPWVSTPVGDMAPLLVEANAVNTLLTHRFVRPAPSWPNTTLALMLGASVIAPASSRRRWPIVLTAAIGLSWIGVAVVCARAHRPVTVVLVPAVAAGAVLCRLLLRQVDAGSERRRVRQLFGQYVPDFVARQLLDSGRQFRALDGQRHTVTALFVDLRSFTPLAAQLEPSQIRLLLNEFYDRIGSAVFAEGGTVLQYVGDEVFAVFGAPLPMDAHAATALRSARAMFAGLDGLQVALAAHGLPPVNFGIGLHSGEVVAAHVGSAARMQYSVIGDAVNVASRHAALAEPGEIVVSATTAALVDVADGRFADGHVDKAALKGVAETVNVWRIRAGPAFVSGDGRLVSD